MLRQRKIALKAVKELDAFPKVPDGYKETSVSGGGVSIVVFLVIGVLVVSEFMYYTATDLKFEYDVDPEPDKKIQINIDMTIAMKCEWVGADVLDLTQQRADLFGSLEEESVHYDLSPRQRHHFEMMHNMNDYIRNEYHAIHKLLFKTGFSGLGMSMPDREITPEGPTDACRLHGSLTVNKVAGNFHITAGKPLIYKGDHFHNTANVRPKDYNFSHRIDHFSFGEPTPGIINPLDTEEKIAKETYHMFQYFIQVVPTKVQTRFSTLETYQYASTEKNRTINHHKGSHGVPGIFMKYDMSALRVAVREDHKPYWQFLVRLCGIIGGIFATSGMLHTLSGSMYDILCCRLQLGKYGKSSPSTPTQSKVEPSTPLLDNPDVVLGSSLLSEGVPSIGQQFTSSLLQTAPSNS